MMKYWVLSVVSIFFISFDKPLSAEPSKIIVKKAYIEDKYQPCFFDDFSSLLKRNFESFHFSCLPESLPSRVGFLKDVVGYTILHGQPDKASMALNRLENEVDHLPKPLRNEFSDSIRVYRYLVENISLGDQSDNQDLELSVESEELGTLIGDVRYSVDTGALFSTKKLEKTSSSINVRSFTGGIIEKDFHIENGLVFISHEENYAGLQYINGFRRIIFGEAEGENSDKTILFWSGNLFFIDDVNVKGKEFYDQILCVDTGSTHSFIDNSRIYSYIKSQDLIDSEDIEMVEIASSGEKSLIFSYDFSLVSDYLDHEYKLVAKSEINRFCDFILGADWATKHVAELSINEGYIRINR